MAIVTVYNRDGTEYGTLDTSQYVFNNNLIGFEPQKLDINTYPYVKINGIYYVNDGEEFYSLGRADNSAGLTDINYCYQWAGNPAPFPVFNLEKPYASLKDWPESEYRYVESEDKNIFGTRENVVMRNFSAGDKHISGLQVVTRQLYDYQEYKKVGFLNEKDPKNNKKTVSKYFNFEGRELICHNFYSREIDDIEMDVLNNLFYCNNKTYDLNLYKIVLCYVPPLDKSFYVGMDYEKSVFKYKNKSITIKYDNKDGNIEGRIHDFYWYINNGEELSYSSPKIYHLNQGKTKYWKNLWWGEVQSSEWEDFIELKNISLTSGVSSYADQLIDDLLIYGQTSPSLWEARFTYYNEVIATSYYDFVLSLKNVPCLKHAGSHTTYSESDYGVVWSGGYPAEGNQTMIDANRETFCWALSPYGAASGIGPSVSLYDQTIYRNKQEFWMDIQSSRYTDASRFGQWYFQINFSRKTRDEGFFVLYAVRRSN